ncbi:MAG: hypothetical protein F4Y84_06695 [Caldilineaceae bacterium SB0665_bin_25]|nr:hypothetical protein [Caldilineaceae bacterium SB0665_bin_25]
MTTEERVARLEGEISHMATKADIEAVRGEIAGVRGEIADVRGELGNVRGEIGNVRGELGKLSATLTWRMILIASAIQAIGIGALLQFLPRA